MIIRLATINEINEINQIYERARSYMKQTGNATQWGNANPCEALLIDDINHHHLYVCEEDKTIYGVFALLIGDDPTYKEIYQGKWLNDEPYVTIHRLASAGVKKGISSLIFDWVLTTYKNIRIDTHENNLTMHNLLTNYGFKKCGIIYLQNGSERIAYQFVK